MIRAAQQFMSSARFDGRRGQGQPCGLRLKARRSGCAHPQSRRGRQRRTELGIGAGRPPDGAALFSPGKEELGMNGKEIVSKFLEAEAKQDVQGMADVWRKTLFLKCICLAGLT